MRRAATVLRQLRPMSGGAGSTEAVVLSHQSGGLAVATLNRPKVLNSLDLDMVRILDPLVQKWSSDESVHAVLLKGTGEKAFCAGGDVVSVAQSGKKGGADGGAFARNFFREEYILDYNLAQLVKPFIVFMDGITMGGGVGLSVPAKFRVATEKTLFAMPETGIGLFPDVGGSYYLPKLEGELGMYLALTGARLKGEDVVKAGIATHFVPSSELDVLESELTQLPKSDQHRAVAELLDQFDRRTAADATFTPHMAEINHSFAATSVEGILERLEASGTEWATKQRGTILKMSPTSLKVTHEQLRRGATMTLAECFQMEYRITQGCMRETDFFEGIRALLIDKDQSPKWSPATLADVSPELVESHFAPVDNDLHL